MGKEIYCKEYISGKVRIDREGLLICRKDCPYENKYIIRWELEELPICRTKGKILNSQESRDHLLS